MKKVFILFILLILTPAKAAFDLVIDWEGATTSNIGDTTTPFAGVNGDDDCPIYNGGRQQIFIGNPQIGILGSGNGGHQSYTNTPGCPRQGVTQASGVNPSCSGNFAYKTMLDARDPVGGGRERSEITSIQGLVDNQQFADAFSIYLPSDYQLGNIQNTEIHYQIHGAGSTTGGLAGKIPFSLRINTSGQWVGHSQFCSNPSIGSPACDTFSTRSGVIGTAQLGWNHFLIIGEIGFTGSEDIDVWYVEEGGTPPVEGTPQLNLSGGNKVNTGSPAFRKHGLYISAWDNGPAGTIAAGRPTATRWVDNIVIGDQNETWTSMVAKAFPNWLCANNAPEVPPIPVDDTLAAQTEGYGTFSVAWSTLLSNDTTNGAVTLTSVAGTTPSLCTIVNDTGNSEIDVTEVGGTGSCQFTYKITDTSTAVESAGSATVFTQVDAAGGSTSPPSLAVPDDDGNAVAVSVTGGDITIPEPTGWAENEYGLVMHAVRSSTIPSLNTGYTNVCTVSANGSSFRISYIKRGASAPDMTFTTGTASNALVVMARILDADQTTFIDASACIADPNGADGGTTTPGVTTTGTNSLVLEFGVNDRNSFDGFTSPTLAEDYDIGPTGNVLSVNRGHFTQGTPGATQTHFDNNVTTDFVHTATVAINGVSSAAATTILSDTFTASDDTALDGRTPSPTAPTAGDTTWSADGTCDIDSNKISCNAIEGASISTGVINQDISFDFVNNADDDGRVIVYFRGDSVIPDMAGTEQNGYYLDIRPSVNQIVFGERVAGINSDFSTIPVTLDASTTYDIDINVSDDTAICTNTTITVSIDGASGTTANTSSCLPGTFFKPSFRNVNDGELDTIVVTSNDTPDTVVPTAPTHTGAIQDQLVTLTVTPGSDSGLGIEGYEVHKDDCAAGSFTLLSTVLNSSASVSTFQDTIGASETCRYQIRMRDNAGNLSSFSASTSHTAITNTPPVCDASFAKTFTIGAVVTVDVEAEANCIDDDGDTLTVTAITQAGVEGQALITSPVSNSITYEPDLDAETPDTVIMTVSDGNGGTDSVTMNATIQAGAAPGNLFFETTLYRHSTGAILANQTGISFSCSSEAATGVLVNHNIIDNGAYLEADERTDANGVLTVVLTDAIAKGLTDSDTVKCLLFYPDASVIGGFIFGGDTFTLDTTL